MKNKMLMGIFVLFLVSIVAFAGITYAYKGNANVQGPNYNEEVHEQLEAAIEAGDYDAWLQIRKDNNLPMRGKIFQVINEDNFDKYAAMHEAMESGDTETADAIRAELGLGQGMMNKGNNAVQTARQGIKQGTGVKSGLGMGLNSGTHNCGSCPYN